MLKIYLFNTLTRKIEEFIPIEDGKVKIYSCGPTVYDYQHIGNLYSAVFADYLARIFRYLGYEVINVMNITDVGHLTSDSDEGEDKLEKGAKKYGKSPLEIAQFFTEKYLEDVEKLNITHPTYRPRATEFIQKMIEMNKILKEKGYAYETNEALYFEVDKFENYTRLSKQKLEDLIQAARDEVNVDPQKKKPYDFALWFKRIGRFKNHILHWDSPWGDGFPGWHIECSAMAFALLGEQIDIHTGGPEHINIHHTNEIAQSEGVSGKQFVRYWLHHQHILVEGQKMSKSLGNTYLLSDLQEKGFHPLALRLLYLQNKYRDQLNFTFDSLTASQNALRKIYKQIRELFRLSSFSDSNNVPSEKLQNTYQQEFENAIADDLNVPKAVGVFFQLLKDQNINVDEKLKQILSFDEVLGLKIRENLVNPHENEINKLKSQWNQLRAEKRWEEADRLRTKVSTLEDHIT
ncbi:MAG: cysteine--tRNA ligase [Candidatus Dojkabacteria bacterium]|nr:cysteine--tRNA ligase [Candidatus Dojkabacteria bacterium]